MQFVGYRCRNEGRLLPRHVLWAGRVLGHLYVREQYDAELSRHVRVATLEDGAGHQVVLGPLLDAVLVSCKPDWWTMTGWERIDTSTVGAPRAYQQSWMRFGVISPRLRKRARRYALGRNRLGIGVTPTKPSTSSTNCARALTASA